MKQAVFGDCQRGIDPCRAGRADLTPSTAAAGYSWSRRRPRHTCMIRRPH